MRWATIVFSLVFIVASAVWASDLTRLRAPTKGNSHVGLNPGQPDGREGGETIEDAFLINALPFLSETGNTCDNVDDYDVVCPHPGSTSPDVVYAFTPGRRMSVHIDLCSDGNQYDTKVYVYEDTWTPGYVHACNDDFCSNSWTPYASRLESVPMFVGHTYFIVIDGYGGDCGNYQLFVEEAPPPTPVECGPNHVPEDEPELVDYYEDHYNGGCSSSPPVFQYINWIDIETDCAHLCGVSGWYNLPNAMYRDTDSFRVISAGSQIDIAINSDHFTMVLVSSPNPTCSWFNWDVVDCFEAYDPQAYSVPTNPGDVHWIRVSPCEWVDQPDFLYELEVCGIEYLVVPTETVTWGGVKVLYR